MKQANSQGSNVIMLWTTFSVVLQSIMRQSGITAKPYRTGDGVTVCTYTRNKNAGSLPLMSVPSESLSDHNWNKRVMQHVSFKSEDNILSEFFLATVIWFPSMQQSTTYISERWRTLVYQRYLWNNSITIAKEMSLENCKNFKKQHISAPEVSWCLKTDVACTQESPLTILIRLILYKA